MTGTSVGGNLYIVDSEVVNAGLQLASHRDFLCESIEKYLSIMDYVTSEQEGDAINAIKGICNQLRSVPASLMEAGDNFQTDCDQYVSDIDEADQYLY